MAKRISLIGLSSFALIAFVGSFAPLLAQVPEPVEKTAQKAGKVLTDSWIKMKIYTQFVPEKALDDSDIDVDIKSGMVTLNGTVMTAAGRDRAVAIAKATDGVKEVTDNLRIAPGSSTPVATSGSAPIRMSDGFIKARIYGQLTNEAALEGSDIDVDVDDSIVTLKGTVRSEAGRTRAATIAKGVAGVKSVNDRLTISTR
jgi:hyperosmotically inducible periplasmic protein